MRRATKLGTGLGTGLAWALVAMALAPGCDRSAPPALSEQAQRGRGVYMNVCVACHNADPAKDGAIGPNLVGTTRELIEWRVVKGAYPPGYTPKRATGAMPAFPHLAADVDALYAFVRESTATAAQ
jgi:mono/diheme cytochrome c family protein